MDWPKNLGCWCILTTLRTDQIVVTVCLISLIFKLFWLCEMGQIWSFMEFSGKHKGGKAWNMACWCILTTSRNDWKWCIWWFLTISSINLFQYLPWGTFQFNPWWDPAYCDALFRWEFLNMESIHNETGLNVSGVPVSNILGDIEYHESLDSSTKMLWWHHCMEMLSILLALCDGNSLDSGGFLHKAPVMQS